MAHRILIPTPLRPYAEQQAAVDVEGANVGEALASLTTRYTDLRRHLYSDDGKLRSFVNVYVNDQDIRQLQRDGTRLKPGDVISIVPSVAGGAPVTGHGGTQTTDHERTATDEHTRTQKDTGHGRTATDEHGKTRKDTGHGRTRTNTENRITTQDSTALPELTSDEFQRYSRHLMLPEVGVNGQRRLKAARVVCVGAGGLGSPAALYLAAAGVGTLGIIDFDAVDASNLQRQILHSTADVGRSKLESARDRLSALNPSVHIETHDTALSSSNALEIFRDYDVVVDGTDNFATRYLVNDACVLLGKPNAYGSIFRFEGQASVFATAGGPCYRCLYPEPPPPGLVPSCAEGGVLGVLPGVIGTIQATETIKLILGAGTTLAGRLLLYDAWTLRFREMKLRRDPECPVCGDAPTIRELIDYEQFCGTPRAAAAPGPTPLPPELETNVDDLHARVHGQEPPYILDVREPQEFQICRIPGSTLIPLGELPSRVAELRAAAGNREIVVHCKGGTRSAKAVNLLREQGFDRIKNLKGGILAWIDRIDPSLPKY